jgi:hypothetical protein
LTLRSKNLDGFQILRADQRLQPLIPKMVEENVRVTGVQMAESVKSIEHQFFVSPQFRMRGLFLLIFCGVGVGLSPEFLNNQTDQP